VNKKKLVKHSVFNVLIVIGVVFFAWFSAGYIASAEEGQAEPGYNIGYSSPISGGGGGDSVELLTMSGNDLANFSDHELLFIIASCFILFIRLCLFIIAALIVWLFIIKPITYFIRW
jgi:hypothetical protein